MIFNEKEFKLISSVGALASFGLIGGLIGVVVFSENPQSVIVLSTVSIICLITSKLTQIFESIERRRLDYSEAVERGFLLQIRQLVKDGEKVSEDHISISQSATNEADSEYKRLYGFTRTHMAVAATPQRPISIREISES